MRASAPATPACDLSRIYGIADVPEDHVRSVGGLAAIQGGDHQVIMNGDLRRDPILRSFERNEFDELRTRGIRHVQDAPALVEGMAHVEIPASIRGAVECHLERSIAAAQPGKTDYFDVFALAAARYRVGL